MLRQLPETHSCRAVVPLDRSTANVLLSIKTFWYVGFHGRQVTYVEDGWKVLQVN